MKAVILAGGLGTRLSEETLVRPKLRTTDWVPWRPRRVTQPVWCRYPHHRPPPPATCAVNATAASLAKLLAWRPGGYPRASGAPFGWLAMRTLAQTALFVLVARTLGAKGYGSLIMVISSQPQRLPELTSDLLRLWLFSSPVLSVLAVLTSLLALGDILSLPAIFAIVAAHQSETFLIAIQAFYIGRQNSIAMPESDLAPRNRTLMTAGPSDEGASLCCRN